MYSPPVSATVVSRCRNGIDLSQLVVKLMRASAIKVLGVPEMQIEHHQIITVGSEDDVLPVNLVCRLPASRKHLLSGICYRRKCHGHWGRSLLTAEISGFWSEMR